MTEKALVVIMLSLIEEDGMADDEAGAEREPEQTAEPVEPQSRSTPERRADTEQAIGLEVARLFGVSPRLLVKRPPQPPRSSEPS
jgi:hypothetical protein